MNESIATALSAFAAFAAARINCDEEKPFSVATTY
jgi:hypothetical protein